MDITQVKHWKKLIKGEAVQHVKIGYVEDDRETLVHQSGEKAVATPEFYQAFRDMSLCVCKACGLSNDLATGIVVNAVQVLQSEDKEGNDNSSYKLFCSLKSGHATTSITVDIQHKYLPDGFYGQLTLLLDQAEEYIDGKRGQTDLFDKKPEGEQAAPESDSDTEDADSEEQPAEEATA